MIYFLSFLQMFLCNWKYYYTCLCLCFFRAFHFTASAIVTYIVISYMCFCKDIFIQLLSSDAVILITILHLIIKWDLFTTDDFIFVLSLASTKWLGEKWTFTQVLWCFVLFQRILYSIHCHRIFIIRMKKNPQISSFFKLSIEARYWFR